MPWPQFLASLTREISISLEELEMQISTFKCAKICKFASVCNVKNRIALQIGNLSDIQLMYLFVWVIKPSLEKTFEKKEI